MSLEKLLSDDTLERLVIAPSSKGFTAEAIVQTKSVIPYDPSGRRSKLTSGATKLEALEKLVKMIYEENKR